MTQVGNHSLPERPVVLLRGFRGLCPCCGRGRLFKSYLKQNEFCPVCNTDFSAIQADDGPGWFVMVLIGAIVVPVAIFLSLHEIMPDWAVFTLLVVLAIGGVLLLLPRAKGIFIALLWRLAKEKAAGPPS
ncbi:MAG TPA: DUF983 domain-containing protein [Alphaproteobacteria bacterium]|jgi:uncharacterized protein (DUF983 family)|nr:DUF983 domain-containing protein [Alphaproteobacteria bacterium]